MTNETVDDIMKVVRETTTSPHVAGGHGTDAGGILGMGEGVSLIAAFVFFLVVLYIIGVIYHRISFKVWLIPRARYWLEIGRSFSILGKAWMGIPSPRAFVDSSDPRYTPLDPAAADRALAKARTTMKSLGITFKEAYKDDAFDCVDSGFILKGLATFYASQDEAVDTRNGIPFSLFGYRREGAGGKKVNHVDIRVLRTDGERFYQPYPEYPDPVEVSPTERMSRNLMFT